MSTNITQIPEIMRHKGWVNAGRLMQRWLDLPAYSKPNYALPDTTTIKMDSWVLEFSRAKFEYLMILKDKIWLDKQCKKIISDQIKTECNLSSPKPASFGRLAGSASILHKKHVNHRSVSTSAYHSLDDMTASLGTFAFYVLVSGVVRPNFPELVITSNTDTENILLFGHRVRIEEVGIYVADSYDFEDDSWLKEFFGLGYWSNEDKDVYGTPHPSATRFENKDFRQWRSDTGKGGDFRIFSDIKTVILNPPDEFYI